MSATDAAHPAVEVPVVDDPATPGDGRRGRYAGIVSRTVSNCADAVILAIVGVGTLFVLQAVVAMVEGKPFGDVTLQSDWAVVIIFGQSALYFIVGWAVFGRSGGEALVGLRVVRRDGRALGWPRSILRFILVPLTYAVCGLGYIWILIDNRRRTWTDLAAGTVVVYDWRRADERPVDVLGAPR